MPQTDPGHVCGWGTTMCGKPARHTVLVWVRTKNSGDDLVGAVLRVCGVHRRVA